MLPSLSRLAPSGGAGRPPTPPASVGHSACSRAHGSRTPLVHVQPVRSADLPRLSRWLLRPMPANRPIACLSIVGGLAAAVLLSILLVGLQLPAWMASVVVGVAIGVLLLMACTTRDALLRLRAGRWRMRRPRSVEEITRVVREHGQSVGVVAQGWSYWAQYRRATEPTCLLLSSNWAGIGPLRGDGRIAARAGTLFSELTAHLQHEGRALADRPMYDGLSVGAAVRSGSHGFADAWFIHTVARLVAIDCTTGTIHEAHRHETAAFATLARDPSWIILEVEMDTVANVVLRVEQTVGPRYGADRHAKFDAASYRLLFVCGSHVMMRVGFPTNIPLDAPQVVRHGSLGLRVEAAMFQLFGKSIERTDYQPRTAAHVFVRDVWPTEMFSMRALQYINLEVMASVPSSSIPALVEATRLFHEAHGGRTEVRYDSRSGIVGLDLALAFSTCCQKRLRAYCHALYAEGLRRVALHEGKYHPSDIAPLTRVEYGVA